MGNFESFEFGATVTMDHSDLGYTDQEAREIDPIDLATDITELVMTVLTDLLRDEIVEAAGFTDEDKSFLLANFQLAKPKRRS
jgi:hypothetical protein